MKSTMKQPTSRNGAPRISLRKALLTVLLVRTKSRDAEAIRRLATDPHSPPEFRCNGVIRNIDEFYDAFGVTSDDELFLATEDRVRIWS